MYIKNNLIQKVPYTIECKASYVLDFQVLVLKEVMNSLFEYVFLTNSYARLVLFVYLYLTIQFYSSTEVLCVLLKT